MTIALFGATGKTGGRVLDRLLAAQIPVHALVRDPAKLTVESALLTVIKGDVLDGAAVDRTVAGSDAVLAMFGQVKGSSKTLQTDGTQSIVEAMKGHGVTRVVTLSGGGLRGPQDKPRVPDHMIRGAMKLLAGHVLADAEGHLEVLEQSGLDWTVVRGPRLNENPGKGTYRVGWVGVNGSTQISRDDLADFIVTQIDDRTFLHQMPFISD